MQCLPDAPVAMINNGAVTMPPALAGGPAVQVLRGVGIAPMLPRSPLAGLTGRLARRRAHARDIVEQAGSGVSAVARFGRRRTSGIALLAAATVVVLPACQREDGGLVGRISVVYAIAGGVMPIDRPMALTPELYLTVENSGEKLQLQIPADAQLVGIDRKSEVTSIGV
jgi:hypothetical protein